ncbi:hypothetical protein FJTKL_14569 [Diaporthe vaccinii]|uniref:Secreted protein n=1 Tax=Diaporthe vaccinii TaxID=105482 RepID=A0ABR4E782_9PEZI
MSPALAVLSGIFRATQFCQHAMRSCSVGSPHTRDIHTTRHETTIQDTRSTRPQHADVTTHYKQRSKITTSCLSFISPPLSTFSRISTLHIFTVTGDLPVGCGHGLRKVFCLFFSLRLILGPNACADRSGRARSLHQIGFCI